MPLIHKSVGGAIHWYDPIDGEVYERQTDVRRGFVTGRYHFSPDGQAGVKVPFEAWVRRGGAYRVLDAIVYPVPPSVRERIGMPPREPVYL